MNLKLKLSGRIQMNDIHEITSFTQGNSTRKKELYNLLYDTDDMIAYQAAWTLTHLSVDDNKWLYDKQNELIDEALICSHPGKRRLLLALLLRQPLADPLRVDFLDFCFERMNSTKELPGVKSLCMKLAYEMCRHIPELMREMGLRLDMMIPYLLQPSMQAVRKNVLKAMKTGRSL